MLLFIINDMIGKENNNSNNNKVENKNMEFVFEVKDDDHSLYHFRHAINSCKLKIPIEGSNWAVYIRDYNPKTQTIQITFEPSDQTIKQNQEDLAIVYSLFEDRYDPMRPTKSDIDRRFKHNLLFEKTKKALETENQNDKNNKIDVGAYKNVKIFIAQHGNSPEIPYKIILDKNKNISHLNSLYITDSGCNGRLNIMELYEKLTKISNTTNTICLFSLSKRNHKNKLVENYTTGKYPVFTSENKILGKIQDGQNLWFTNSCLASLFYKNTHFDDKNQSNDNDLQKDNDITVKARIEEIFGKIPYSLFLNVNLGIAASMDIFFRIQENSLVTDDYVNNYFLEMKKLLQKQNGYQEVCNQLQESINNETDPYMNDSFLDNIVKNLDNRMKKGVGCGLNFNMHSKIVETRKIVLLHLLMYNKIGREVLSKLFKFANQDLSQYKEMSFDIHKLQSVFWNFGVSFEPIDIEKFKDLKDYFNDYYWFFKGKMYNIPHICVTKRRDAVAFYKEILQHIDKISVADPNLYRIKNEQGEYVGLNPLMYNFGYHQSYLVKLTNEQKKAFKKNIEQQIHDSTIYQKAEKKYPIIGNFKQKVMSIIGKGVEDVDEIHASIISQEAEKKYPIIGRHLNLKKKVKSIIIDKGVEDVDDVVKELAKDTNDPALLWKVMTKQKQQRDKKHRHNLHYGEQGWDKLSNIKPTKAINANFGIGRK